MFRRYVCNCLSGRSLLALVCLSSVLSLANSPASFADVGQPFFHGCTNPAEIRVRAGHWVDGITTICGDGRQLRAGGDGGNEYAFRLQPGEVITRISGSKIAPGFPYVITLQIHTNLRSSPMYGGQGTLVAEQAFNEPVPGGYFTGLHGVAGQYLNDIHLAQPTSSPPATSSNVQQGGHDSGGWVTGDERSPPAAAAPVYASPSTPPPASRPQQVQSVRVMIRNSNALQMGVYVDDPQAGLVHQMGLPFASSYVHWYPVGTILVFGPEGGAAVKVYKVGSSPEQYVEIEGEPQQAAVQTHTQAQTQAQTQTQAPPPVRTTEASISGDGVSYATQIAGIGTFDESTRAMHLRTRAVTLRTEIVAEDMWPVILEFNPQVYAWYENGSTLIRVDTHGSHLRVENYHESEFEQGFYIENITMTTDYPQNLQLVDYFPETHMDSTQVSSSRSFSIGGTAGPHPYNIGVSASLDRTFSSSASVPDFKSETKREAAAVSTVWFLCGIEGRDDTGRTGCVYNEPRDLGYREDGRWISALAKVPAMATNFPALRQTFVLTAPGLLFSTVDVGFGFDVGLRSAHLKRQVGDVFKPGAEIGTAFACINPESETCKSMKKGVGIYNFGSREASRSFDIRLSIDLAPLASTIQRRGLQ